MIAVSCLIFFFEKSVAVLQDFSCIQKSEGTAVRKFVRPAVYDVNISVQGFNAYRVVAYVHIFSHREAGLQNYYSIGRGALERVYKL